MNDYPELARKAGEFFNKRFHEKFGNDAVIISVEIDGKNINIKVSIHKDWETPLVKDILSNIAQEVYEFMNQGMA